MKKMKRIANALRSRFGKRAFRPVGMDVPGPRRLYRYFPRGRQDVPLGFVLDYLREDGGFTINIKPDAQVNRSISLRVDRQPSHEEALAMIRQTVAGMGCTVVRKGRVLTIVTSREAKKNCIPLPIISPISHEEAALAAE